jgi:hypothetical protein
MFIHKCRLCSFYFHHHHCIMFLYGGGRLLLINVNLSCHGQLQIHAHTRNLLRNNNSKLSKNFKQQPIMPMSKLSELRARMAEQVRIAEEENWARQRMVGDQRAVAMREQQERLWMALELESRERGKDKLRDLYMIISAIEFILYLFTPGNRCLVFSFLASSRLGH